MHHLVSIRTNVLYAKEKIAEKDAEPKYKRYQELIFLVDKPIYRYSNEGEVVRERGLEEQRFIVSEKAFVQMMEMLSNFQNIDENDLV